MLSIAQLAPSLLLPYWIFHYIWYKRGPKREVLFTLPRCKASEPCSWQVLPTERAGYFPPEQRFPLEQPGRWGKDRDCAGIRHAQLSMPPLSIHKSLSSWSHTHHAKQVATLPFPPCKKPHEALNKMRLHSHLHRPLHLSRSETELSLLSWTAKPIPSHIWLQWNTWVDLTPV